MKFDPDTLIHYLKPGGFFFLKKPGIIRTVLGSCVTITMLSKRTGFGAACHPVLPQCRDRNVCNFAGCRDKFKYVECVIPEMMRLFRKERIMAEELEVKMFGGSELINNNSGPTVFKIGASNIEMAIEKLHGLDLRLTSLDTGGIQGRRLFFDTSNGDVWIKKLTANTTSLFEKKDMQKQLLMQKKG